MPGSSPACREHRSSALARTRRRSCTVTTAGSQPGAKACRSSVTESVQYVRTDRVTEDRQASLRLILVPSWRCVARRVPSQGTPGSTRKPEAAGQAPGAPNRPETGQNERERNRSTPKSRRIRGGAPRVASGSHAKCCNQGGCSHAIDWPAENTLLVEYLRHATHAWKSALTDASGCHRDAPPRDQIALSRLSHVLFCAPRFAHV